MGAEYREGQADGALTRPQDPFNMHIYFRLDKQQDDFANKLPDSNHFTILRPDALCVVSGSIMME